MTTADPESRQALSLFHVPDSFAMKHEESIRCRASRNVKQSRHNCHTTWPRLISAQRGPWNDQNTTGECNSPERGLPIEGSWDEWTGPNVLMSDITRHFNRRRNFAVTLIECTFWKSNAPKWLIWDRLMRHGMFWCVNGAMARSKMIPDWVVVLLCLEYTMRLIYYSKILNISFSRHCLVIIDIPFVACIQNWLCVC